ncbi:MAG: peptidoglycan DD-metalloendopeptidase family protein [Myxococcaceae bacterium]|nr:peptidoglycan DD-metalloendopeptidase family protein [Myxococcaceae bacterium]
MTRVLLVAAAALAGSAVAAPFTYQPPGTLKPNAGTGRVDYRVYSPNMRFPIKSAPAYAGSMVYGYGGLYGPGGSACDARNFSYPWTDNYCEKRQWNVPLCPSGIGHQGQDVRAASCVKEIHPTVAAADGTITSIGTYILYLAAADGTVYRYGHMGKLKVRVGQKVKVGDELGMVSNEFGGTPTGVHLHFDIKQNIAGLGLTFVPPYLSLVKSYERLLGIVVVPPKPDAGTTVDAGRPDAGRADAGRADAGRADAGAHDAGRVDAGLRDAGVPDAAVELDDAGTELPIDFDAGVDDPDFEGVLPDGGSIAEPLPELGTPVSSGCGCSAGSPVLSLTMLLGWALRRRRR